MMRVTPARAMAWLAGGQHRALERCPLVALTISGEVLVAIAGGCSGRRGHGGARWAPAVAAPAVRERC